VGQAVSTDTFLQNRDVCIRVSSPFIVFVTDTGVRYM
jgi:hypothetical protein